MINLRFFLFVILTSFSSLSLADALAPSLLELKEHADGQLSMKWKMSLKKASTLKLAPVLSSGCEQVLKGEQERDQVRRTLWDLHCESDTLVGKTISMQGLDSSGASVLLKVHLRDGQFYQRILSSDNTSYEIPEAQSRLEIFSDYVAMGIKHLLVGVDHILFVICLVLLVSERRKLILVVSMFTLGHSVTLSLSTLGLVTVSTTVAEVFIAFSVLYAAAELLDKNNKSLIRRYPAMMAAAFGLLHGLGFASVLSDVGVPQLHIPLSLFAFNVGIEIGQLIVIFVLLGLAFLLRSFMGKLKGREVKVGELKPKLPIYAVGCLSSLWFWERMLG